ncbi:MAG: hypothetical protein L0Y67_01195 [Gammaproteobacteria bacterium]|nr:hypothetical protein [Gammaproteobacteria bacterium]
MKTQNLIKQTLSRAESVVVVQQIVEDNGEASRTAIAERVCEQFGFFNALGKAQIIGCLKALREFQSRAIRFAASAKESSSGRTEKAEFGGGGALRASRFSRRNPRA